MSGLPLFRLLLAALLAAPLLVQADPRYAVTVVGGANSRAYDLNNVGQVVGALDVGGVSHAFLYSGSTFIDLGTLGGANSGASAINDSGVIVGTSETASSSSGFIYHAGVMSAIPTTYFSSANAINNAGAVVGMQLVDAGGDQYRHAFVYAGGAMTDLGTLPYGDDSHGLGINSAGHIVGAAANLIDGAPNRPTTSFLYRDGVMTDIGNFGGIWSAATSINDLGHVVGYSGLPDPIGPDLYPQRAFLYIDGVMHNLGSLVHGMSTTADDINNLGQVVGWGAIGSGNHGFLFAEGAMVDLNTLIDPAAGWTITEATGINDLQQIAGTACRDGTCYAVRLDLVSAIPEPPTYAMLFAGAVLVGFARRRKQRSDRFR